RRAAAKRLAPPGGCARANARIPGHEPGSLPPRLSFCGPHHLLRLHASGGHGQRPHRHVFPAYRGGRDGRPPAPLHVTGRPSGCPPAATLAYAAGAVSLLGPPWPADATAPPP